MAKGLWGLEGWVVEGAVGIWEAFPLISSLVGACAGVICSRCLIVLFESLLILLGCHPLPRSGQLEQLDHFHVVLASFTGVVAGYMAFNLMRLSSLPATSRRWWARFCVASYLLFMAMNLAANFLDTRTSQEALFNAFWFSTFGALFHLHREFLRLVFNALACFSWHFIKRGTYHLSLIPCGLLLITCYLSLFTYCSSLITDCATAAGAGSSSSLQHIVMAVVIFCCRCQFN